jgi:uncharacterized protein (TIGR02118 family)
MTTGSFPAAARGRLADHAYHVLLHKIVTAEFREGDPLPSESELSALFEVSRPVVREALKRLRTQREMLENLEFRRAIEPQAAALAAERRQDTHLAAIQCRRGRRTPCHHHRRPRMSTEKTYTKRLGILRKREDMTHEPFVAHWMVTHAELCKTLPGLRRYSVKLVDRERFARFGYDGFSELWFDAEEALHAAFASPEGKVLLADLPNFTSQIDPIISVETQKL